MKHSLLLWLWLGGYFFANAQQPSYGSLMRHFQGDAPKARDSLALYRAQIRVLAADRDWQSLLRTDRIDTLVEIDLSHLGITSVPKLLREADSLRVLYLNENQIRRLPNWMRHLPYLERIEWNNNELAGRKLKWGRLPALEVLEVEGNGQTKLRSTRKLKRLKRLSLAENDFASIPIRPLRKNDSLRELSLNGNARLSLGPAKYHQLRMLQTLKVHRCQLTSFDPSLYKMTGLTDLQFVDNQLRALPLGIDQLEKLVKLSFYKNQLESLPADIFDLRALEVIDLYYNELTVISPLVQQWQNLLILYLSNNRIYDLPEAMGGLSGLQELYVHHNRLSVLPQSLERLTKTHTLRVDHNYLSEFPSQILSMRKLRYLDISHNDMTTLPQELAASFPDLTLFNYLENPINFDPGPEYLAPMIHSMIEKGVICTPQIDRRMEQSDNR